jgi:hypothetical protein
LVWALRRKRESEGKNCRLEVNKAKNEGFFGVLGHI